MLKQKTLPVFSQSQIQEIGCRRYGGISLYTPYILVHNISRISFTSSLKLPQYLLSFVQPQAYYSDDFLQFHFLHFLFLTTFYHSPSSNFHSLTFYPIIDLTKNFPFPVPAIIGQKLQLLLFHAPL